MDLDPGIICLTHCSRRIFCTVVPEKCPICGLGLGNDIFPFSGFKEHDDLHIGVTSSQRVLYEYDKRGLTISSQPTAWDQSLLVYRETNPEIFPQWDLNLKSVAEHPTWTPSNYSENDFNCYDFVLTFLRTMNGHVGESAQDRTGFMEQFVTPEITKATKYIKLHREIMSYGCHVSEV